ncbi:NADPH-dependent FMN reductase [Nocardia cyriacigeorgica]|uniref:NAD(P)H-dependent oxidoreductase n=1 Tax=Nocardia cyriacigeorgica TaxID=135487 RepID=A0A5R8NBF1_9NOCA|nr:NAD(P)H-dependent oxidoreductase [Nocardia cyriacigeorgica]TLF72833.1 NAD(P)H-dependent oxidoreductase [Nocardia cyriacigeorgica]
MTTPLKLAVIIGSVRDGRFGPVVAGWLADQARAHGGYDVDVIDLADYDIPLELPAVPPALNPDPERPAGMTVLTERLSAADAYVIVTPDYNRSFPASLKAAIDWHFTQWQGKTIGFVGYSGGSGGLLAIEGLRQVFNELDAHTLREYVSFPRYYLLFDENGALREPAEPAGAARTMLDRLHWWASALAAARSVPVA